MRDTVLGIGTVWSGFACVKRIRRHRGGALAPSRTSGFLRYHRYVWRGRKRGQCPAFAAPYTVQPTLLTLCAVTFDRSTPNLPESGHTAMPWCPPEQHTTAVAEVCMRRAGKSRPVDAVQLQQTFASPQPPVYSSRSDYISGDRTCTARNQRLLCSNLPAHRRLHDRSRCQIAERC